MYRHATKQETPLPYSLALSCQAFEVEQLANRHSPSGQQPLVQPMIRVLARPSLETGLIARNGRELVLPQPLQNLRARLEPDGGGILHGEQRRDLLRGKREEAPSPPSTDEENVAGLECEVLVLGTGQNLV